MRLREIESKERGTRGERDIEKEREREGQSTREERERKNCRKFEREKRQQQPILYMCIPLLSKLKPI